MRWLSVYLAVTSLACTSTSPGGAAGAGGESNGGSSPAGSVGAGGDPSGGSGGSAGAPSGTGGQGGLPPFDAQAPDALPLPTREEYLKTLYSLSDVLLSTQILQPSDANYGALVSPSVNPEMHPLHSRAAEAVYPFAVAYKHSNDAKYATAAVILGNWLIKIQGSAGSWIEEWPATTGWDGTSADQLISLAGAYPILKSRLSPDENTRWVNAITKTADWIVANFPKGNINYTPTGSVALVLASRAVSTPKSTWLTKAASLMDATLASVNADNLITGEGMGVDLGYNIAQSLGMIAMYGRLLPSATHVDRAAALLKTHANFMYPNGAIDNSWGTRSYKWTLESGTKTAPGIYFTFALLADKDPSFQRAAQLALAFLRKHFLDEKGWVVYGPHAVKHPSSSPPSNYSTFARAQSIATAVELGPSSDRTAPIPAENRNWFKYFPSVASGLVRTDKIMATLTAYGAIGTYPRESVVRGGSVSALWFEGYGATGFLQLSSQTIYNREEPKHMPTEDMLLPLTPRIETTSGTYYTNLFDDKATLSLKEAPPGIEATATGVLASATGTSSGTTFSWVHQFGKDFYSKEVQVSSAAGVRIVEPFVDNPGNTYEMLGTDSLQITTREGGVWQIKVVSSSGPYQLSAGQDRARYWFPFPGIECYPLTITLGSGPYTVKYVVSRTL